MNATFLFLLLMVPGTFFLGINDTLVRRILRGQVLNQQLLLSFDFMGSAVVLGSLLFIFGLPEIQSGFWIALLINVILNIFAQWAWYTAFKREDASLIAPLRLLTPPFVVLTGFLVLGEKATLGGISGILITVLGLWFLISSEATFKGVRFSDLLRKRGMLLGFWGAFSFALSFPYDKKIVLLSSPVFAAALALFFVGLANFMIGYLLSLKSGNHFFKGFRENWKVIILIPFVHSVGAVLAYASLKFTLAAYAASVKRLWSLWTVILGGRFLKEGNIGRKILATLVMLLGIAVTVFLG